MSDQEKPNNSEQKRDYSLLAASLTKDVEKTPHQQAMSSVSNAAAWGVGTAASLGLAVTSAIYWAPVATFFFAFTTFMTSRAALSATVEAVHDVADARKAAAAMPPPAPPGV